MSVAELKKGWCPTLTKPMESGDGLLVRINLPSGMINATIARAVAALSTQYGNEQIDLTSRGNIQIRGVSTENYTPLFKALSELGVIEEPRAAKVEIPRALAELGYKDSTLTLGLLFGRVTAATLSWLADQSVDGMIYLSTQRTMSLRNISADKAELLLAEAENMGFITRTHDSRRAIEACPGAPACISAHGQTRSLALAIANALPNLAKDGKTIHVSGCIKGCACAKVTSRMITAGLDGYTMAIDAKADDAPLLTNVSAQSVIQILTEWNNA